MGNSQANYIDLARFVGIYAVVLGHFGPFTTTCDYVGRELVYLFHVPLFFVISGMLSKPAPVFKTFFSLIIPYFIYNIISIVKMDFAALFTFDALNLNNAPTWFFAALFFIKIISDFINKGILLYIGGLVLVVAILYFFDIEISRLFGLHAVVYGLPFFLFGKYIKGRMSDILSVGVWVLCACVALLVCVSLYYEHSTPRIHHYKVIEFFRNMHKDFIAHNQHK